MSVEVLGSHLCFDLVIQKLLVEPGEGIVSAVVVQVQGVEHVPAGASDQPGAPELWALAPHTALHSRQGSKAKPGPCPVAPAAPPKSQLTPQVGHSTQARPRRPSRPRNPSNCIFLIVFQSFSLQVRGIFYKHKSEVFSFFKE